MKSVSQVLFVVIALVASFTTNARAEVSYQYPKPVMIETRQITPSHPLNCGMPMMGEEMKLSVVVNFATGSDKLSKMAVAEVAKAAAIIKKHGYVAHVLVEGHTDSAGKSSKNEDLSYRRALRVVHALVEKFGVASNMTIAKGFGDSKPIATNSTPAGRAANRRVEFVLVKE